MEHIQGSSLSKSCFGTYQDEYICTTTPLNVANNVTFLIDNNSLEKTDGIKCHDMGSCKNNGAPKFYFTTAEEKCGQLKIIENEKTYISGDVYLLRRTYYVNQANPTVPKTISYLEGPGSYKAGYTFVQYLFKKEEHERRNAKAALDEVFPSVGDVTGAKSPGQLPRGPSQIYSMRHTAKTDSRVGNIQIAEKNKDEGVGYSSLWTLLDRAKREEESCDEKFIRDNQLQKSTTHQQRDKQASSIHWPHFHAPIMQDWRTYSRFAHGLITEKPELEGLLACGTDGELALIDGLSRKFKFAVFLRCFIHFKDNIKRELASRGMRSDLKQKIIDEKFGKSSGDVMYTGLVDSDAESEFDIKLESLRPLLEDRERENGKGAQKHSFFDWFRKEKVCKERLFILSTPCMNGGLHKEIHAEASSDRGGPGDPPTTYTTNDVEAANFMVKHCLSFDQRTPHDFIADVKKVISIQFNNEERAVIGRGPYRVTQSYSHLIVHDFKWTKMTLDQRRSSVKKFLDTGVDGKKDDLLSNDKESPQDETFEKEPRCLEITASRCGIKNVPLPILQTISEKASKIVSSQGLVVPQPGSTNGSYIVAGYSNKIFIVTPGKGGSLSCDRLCTDKSIKICEHTIALAHVRGTLHKFIEWDKRGLRNKHGNLIDMALQSGPKTLEKNKAIKNVVTRKNRKQHNSSTL
eukprot:gene10347-11424_t